MKYDWVSVTLMTTMTLMLIVALYMLMYPN